ncbi:MAG TPA: polysaccharide biosynthesis C-terminal domain-containing protein, partial [Tepidiformaceae bacterium]|nr:polysaccharide biosynthesis C-terminal domain-containing protein [Tepidiformaceae bacterium]
MIASVLAERGNTPPPAANALRILAVATAVLAPQAVLGTYFEAHAGRPGVGFAIKGVMAAADIVLCVALIPAWGIAGAAVACLAAYSAGTILYIALFRRATGTTATTASAMPMRAF